MLLYTTKTLDLDIQKTNIEFNSKKTMYHGKGRYTVTKKEGNMKNMHRKKEKKESMHRNSFLL